MSRAAGRRWAEGVRAVALESAGLLEVMVARPEDGPGLIAGALRGDPRSVSLADALVRMLRQVRTAPRRRPMLCGACPAPITPGVPFAIARAIPHRDDATRAITFVLCRECAGGPDGGRGKAAEALKRLFPSARPIDVHPGTGRA